MILDQTRAPGSGLADVVASIIIDDAEHSPAWIAKWNERPKEAFREPYQCLTGRDDITDRLSEITCPAVVVHGMDDTAITMDRAEILARGLVGCSGVVQVSGAHAANLTNPEPVNAAVVAFLADLRASRGAVETASQAFSLLARTSGWPPGAMDGAARIPVDTSAALHPSTAALTVLRRILCPRPVGTSQARRGSAAKRGPGQCAEAPRCRARGLRRGPHSLEAPPRSAPGRPRGPPSPEKDTGRGANAPHVGRPSQVKSGIALRETWSRRQAGAMRLVRRAGWVWAARTIQNHHTPCPQESPVVLTPAG